MNFKQITGNRIKTAREALPHQKGRRVTQDEVAKAIQESPSRYGNYEQGTRFPDPDMLLKIAKVVGEPAPYLAGLVNDMRLVELLRIYERMEDDDKDWLLTTAKRGTSKMVSQEVREFSEPRGREAKKDTTPG